MHILCPGTWQDARAGTQPTDPRCWALPALRSGAHRYPALAALRDKTRDRRTAWETLNNSKASLVSLSTGHCRQTRRTVFPVLSWDDDAAGCCKEKSALTHGKSKAASLCLCSQGPVGCVRSWEGLESEVLWFGWSHSCSLLWLVGIITHCFGSQQWQHCVKVT